jgi:putative ATP-binding cassette transporter
MLRPIDFILHILPYIGRAEVSLAKIESLGLSRVNGAHAESAARPRSWTSIELAAVEYTYHEADPDDAFALGPIDLVLRPAEIVYLVGGNGSGKSTLAKLLTGLYEPGGGEIRLDGKVVTAINREEYRQYFTAIFADACVFSKLPTAEIQQPRIEQYLAELHLADKVTLAGDELTTSGLSQGQYKRLALVCAYLEDRPIYVFDEWAADQDPVFREVFYREILQELKGRGKLVVVISHDERFFDVADRLLKLEEGKLVETSVSMS